MERLTINRAHLDIRRMPPRPGKEQACETWDTARFDDKQPHSRDGSGLCWCCPASSLVVEEPNGTLVAQGFVQSGRFIDMIFHRVEHDLCKP